MKTIVALFDELEDAAAAVEALVDGGMRREEISFIARDASSRYEGVIEADEAGDEIAAGVAGGAVVGGLLGILLGLSAFVVPGLGSVIAAGPLAAGFAGATTGAVAGGLLGALVDWGIPEDEAHYYAEALRRGGALVAVRAPEDQVDDVVAVLEENHPVDVERRAAYWREEEGWDGFSEEDDPYPAEEIESYREAAEEWEADWEIEASGDSARIRTYEGDEPNPREYAYYEPRYRRHFETNYGDSGSAFEEHDAAYRYGYTLATSPRYAGSSWSELEPVARELWRKRHPESGWEEVREAVRHGWQEPKQTVEETF